jgi:broad specificity phosphatase PhoE
MKEDLYAATGKLESLLRDVIRAKSEEVLKLRKATNERTWRHTTEGDAAEFRNRVTSAIEELENLYEEISDWPKETEDE